MSFPSASSGVGHGRPTSTTPDQHVSNFASPQTSVGFQDQRLHHETPYDQYTPAAQFGNDHDYQPYVPQHDMGSAWNAGLSGFDSSSEDPLARLLDATGATTHFPASVVNEAQHRPAAGSALDISTGFASLNPSTVPVQPEFDAGQLNFGPRFSIPVDNAFAQEVDPHSLFDSSGADSGSAVHAALSKREPFHRFFAGEDPLHWARSAFHLGLAAPPRQCSIQIGGELINFWLPTQKDYNEWDLADVSYLMQRCDTLRIEVNWQALDTYGFQVRPLVGFTPMGGYDYRPVAQHLPRPAPLQVPAGNPSPLQGLQVPLMHFPQPLEQNTVPQQPQMAQQNQQHVQVSPLNHGHSQVVQPHGASNAPSQSQDATHSYQVVPTALPQQSHTVPAPRQEKKRKARKRKVHNAHAMMQPSGNVKKAADAIIELPTADDRRQHQRNLEMAWWDPKVDNSTVPETDEDQHAYVKILKEAMLDTSQAKDSQEPNTSFTKRWSAAALTIHGYPIATAEMEATCWDLVEMTVKLHKDGPGFLKVHDQRLQDKLEAEQDLTFQQRIDTMVTVMLLSKARVDKLLKHENLGSFVGHPMDILKSTLGNRGHNIRRKDQNQRGKRAQKEDAERAAAAAAGSGVAADGAQAAEEVEEEGKKADEAEEKSRDEGEDERAGLERKDDNNDDDDDDEGDNGGSGMAARRSLADTNNVVDRKDASLSESQNNGRNSTGRSQRQPSNARSHRAGKQSPSSGRSSTRHGTHTPFPSRGHTTPVIDQHPPARPAASPAAQRPRPAPQPVASPLAPSGASRKRPSTSHHELSQPSSPKHSRSASYTASDDEVIYDAPRASSGPSSPGKRRSPDANLDDTYTRHKSARTVDRQIIAPRRSRRPPP
ncbi:uncharacterized protein EKO05_0002621 [Ascochyta rabiei]|uniref:Uncharacterized protein n=1 Tax=Didymella rabiei TaxID=5454 RepID=A0A162ZRW9_DIDRA|nr:uncharacterized protein EKO05_0002621 [Ascochyta rabiei]KZM20774.1 hypothetical protein ST47_g8074 [Ascochyta rabiei]UPX12044.1 hypothetical protein EKO05_0002621 [Ascochyta rabiei]